MRNRLRSAIHLRLLHFAEGLRHIALCVEQGTMTEESARQLKSKLAGFYAEHIVSLALPEKDGEESEAVTLLMDLGVETLIARELAAECSLEDIQAWTAYARASTGLTNPPGLVVSRLRKGVPPPKGGNGRRRYVSGEYAEYIQS